MDCCLKELGGKPMVVDRQMYYWHDASGRLALLVSTHVDDLKLTGDDGWLDWLLKELESKVGKLTVKEGTLTHCGIDHVQKDRNTIVMHQTEYAKGLKAMALQTGGAEDLLTPTFH